MSWIDLGQHCLAHVVIYRFKTSTVFAKPDFVIDGGFPTLLHLYDQRFCFLLQSYIFNEKFIVNPCYLNCFIVDIYPIFKNKNTVVSDSDSDYDYDHQYFSELSISIVSIQKNAMDEKLHVKDSILL